MAGKDQKPVAAAEVVVNLESSPVEGAPSVDSVEGSNQPASDPASPQDIVEQDMIRVRQTGVYLRDGERHTMTEGTVFSSFDYPVDLLIRQNIQLDAIDEDGNVILNLNDEE